jgi:hypothetical protein
MASKSEDPLPITGPSISAARIRKISQDKISQDKISQERWAGFVRFARFVKEDS